MLRVVYATERYMQYNYWNFFRCWFLYHCIVFIFGVPNINKCTMNQYLNMSYIGLRNYYKYIAKIFEAIRGYRNRFKNKVICNRALSWNFPTKPLIGCPHSFRMMTSSNGNIFRVTGHLYGEFTSHRWIPRTKVIGAELWCFLLSAP